MSKVCSKCKSEISFKEYYKQFIKNRYNYNCNYCGSVYKATTLSIIVNTLIMFIPLSYLLFIKQTWIYNVCWIVFWGVALQPLILKYKYVK